MQTIDRLRALERNTRVARPTFLQIAHFALNRQEFTQPEAMRMTGIKQDAVSRTVTGMKGLELIDESDYAVTGRPGRPSKRLVVSLDTTALLLDLYNDLHLSYLATETSTDRESLLQRGVGALALVRNIENGATINAVSDALNLHPITVTHLGIMTTASAWGLTEMALQKATPVQ
jgi:hypothetical protein